MNILIHFLAAIGFLVVVAILFLAGIVVVAVVLALRREKEKKKNLIPPITKDDSFPDKFQTDTDKRN